MRDYETFWNQVVPIGTAKFKIREHHGGLELDIFKAEAWIEKEVKEVRAEIFDLFDRHPRVLADIDLEAARDEFADVMNLAAMGVFELNRLIAERKVEEEERAKKKKVVAKKGKR